MQLEFEALNLPPLSACVRGGRKWEVGGRSYKLAGGCSYKMVGGGRLASKIGVRWDWWEVDYQTVCSEGGWPPKQMGPKLIPLLYSL